MFKKYLETVWLIFLRPILFYTKLPAVNWKDEPLVFCSTTAWVISFCVSLVVFVNQLAPIGVTLPVEVHGWRLILIAPVMVVLAFMFFVIVYSIVGGVLMALLLALFYLVGWLLHFGGRLMGGKSGAAESLKDAYYSSAVSLIMIFPILAGILSRRGIMDFTNFKIGYNIGYSLFVLYLYGILAIASRKTHGIDRWKAFVAALIPIAFMILLGLAVSMVLLKKIQNFVI